MEIVNRQFSETVEQTSTAPRNITHILITLDLLRGLAAFAVFLAHARGASFVEFGSLPITQQTNLVAILFGITRLGQEAVLIFFVLSGFLVGGQIISRALEGSFRLRDYTIDRCSRILLPLIPACIYTVAINFLVFGEPIKLTELLGNMIGLNGVIISGLNHNAPLWTLAYEIWFYILGGVTGHLINQRRKSVSWSSFALLTVCTAVFSLLSARFLLYWVIGAITSVGINVRFRRTLCVAGIMLTLVGGLSHQLAFTSKSFTNTAYIPIEVSESLICSGICLALPWLCGKAVNDGVGFLRGLASWIGGFSYTLYLFHYPTNAGLDLFLPRADAISAVSVLQFFLRCFVCILVCMAFYFLFERNTVSLRRYLRRKILERAASKYKPETRLPT